MRKEIMDRLAEAVKEKIGIECDIEFKEVKKNNGIKLQAILIKKHGETVFPNIYINDLLDGIENYEITVQEAAGEIIGIFNDNQDAGELGDIINFFNKKKILEKVTYQILGKEKNTDMLSGVPRKDLLDLTAVYRVMLDEEDSDKTASFLLTDSLCKAYGITNEEIERAARQNTEMRGFKTIALETLIAETIGVPEEILREKCLPAFVVTSTANVNGAAVMLYWNYFDKLAHKLQSDLYILPSSIHEVLVVPAGMWDPRGLENITREINASGIIADDEILSNNVYFYSLKKGGLYIA